jgi:hypothetical protein
VLIDLRDPRYAHLVPVPVLVNLEILIKKESLHTAEIVDYCLGPYPSRVVPFDEPVEHVVDVLVVDLGNLPLIAELAELS